MGSMRALDFRLMMFVFSHLCMIIIIYVDTWSGQLRFVLFWHLVRSRLILTAFGLFYYVHGAESQEGSSC